MADFATLARSRTLRHPSGVTLITPLLVPSFSSKGFSFERNRKSSFFKFMEFASPALDDTMLISAYDVHYRYAPTMNRLKSIPKMIFVDSGGYEVSPAYDLSHSVKYAYEPKDWSVDQLISVYDKWPRRIPAVLVSYDHPDHRRGFRAQVKNAERLFARYPAHTSAFLIKPTRTRDHYLREVLPEIIANITLLRPFNIVGFTEKELGPSLLDRMVTLSRIRMAMDAQDVQAPIHVFGSLDPVSASLYFISGAEIFDGLTWMRYAFSNGACIYKGNYGAREFGIHVGDEKLESQILVQNLFALKKLQVAMRDFCSSRDFKKFDQNAEFLQLANDTRLSHLNPKD